MRWSVAIAACAALMAPARGALAQSPDAAFAEARSQFEQAVSAVQAGRPADAVALFERSYAARAAPVVAVNLAYCLRGLGRFGEARTWYLRFLETATPDDLARHEATVRAHLEEVSRRLAQVTAGDLVPSDVSVVFDGAPVGRERRWVDPGEHRARASAPGHVAAELTFMVRAGEVVRLSTQLAPVTAETPITRRWWFWTALGVGVAGLATAVLVPLLQTDPPPYPGPQVQLP
jgi:hypothetical protein